MHSEGVILKGIKVVCVRAFIYLTERAGTGEEEVAGGKCRWWRGQWQG